LGKLNHYVDYREGLGRGGQGVRRERFSLNVVCNYEGRFWGAVGHVHLVGEARTASGNGRVVAVGGGVLSRNWRGARPQGAGVGANRRQQKADSQEEDGEFYRKAHLLLPYAGARCGSILM